jgi:hypothetical protein
MMEDKPIEEPIPYKIDDEMVQQLLRSSKREEEHAAEIIKLKARIDRLETSLHEIDREYLKFRAVLIRISNGTDIDPVKTAEDALAGKI